jgi:hypothetical protein
MTIGGKEFEIHYTDDVYPALKLEITILSPDPSIKLPKFDNFLIDTGSDFTFIKKGIVDKLRLKKTGRTEQIESFDGTITEIDFFSARIIISDIMDSILEVGSIDTNESIIGMDIIKEWYLLIACTENKFEILIPDSPTEQTTVVGMAAI